LHAMRSWFRCRLGCHNDLYEDICRLRPWIQLSAWTGPIVAKWNDWHCFPPTNASIALFTSVIYPLALPCHNGTPSVCNCISFSSVDPMNGTQLRRYPFATSTATGLNGRVRHHAIFHFVSIFLHLWETPCTKRSIGTPVSTSTGTLPIGHVFVSSCHL